MNQKLEVMHKFWLLGLLLKKQMNLEIKKLHSDNSSKYTSKVFKQFCEQYGIERQILMSYSSQQNRVAKSKNQTLFKRIRCMLLHKQLLNEW